MYEKSKCTAVKMQGGCLFMWNHQAIMSEKMQLVLTVFKTQENTIRQVKGFATVYVIYVHHSQSQITMLELRWRHDRVELRREKLKKRKACGSLEAPTWTKIAYKELHELRLKDRKLNWKVRWKGGIQSTTIFLDQVRTEMTPIVKPLSLMITNI